MATIVTRAGKGSPLTHNEVDANFVNLNTDKAETASPTFTGQVSLPDGTAASPALTNTGDTDTGIYFPAANQVAVALGGVQKAIMNADEATFKTRFVVDSATNQLALVGNNYANGYASLSMSADGVFDITPLDSSFGYGSLNLSGSLKVNGSVGASGQVLTSGGSGAAPSWQTGGNQVFTASGTVTAGDIVEVNSNGTVSKAGITTNVQDKSYNLAISQRDVATANTYNVIGFENSGYFPSGIISISDTTFVSAHTPSGVTSCVARIVTVASDGTATFGSDFTAISSTAAVDNIVKVSSNSFAILHRPTSTTTAIIIGQVSGSTITFGSSVTFQSGLTYTVTAALSNGSGTLLLVGNTGGTNTPLRAYAASVSGTTVTVGSAFTLRSAAPSAQRPTIAYDSVNNVFVANAVMISSPFSILSYPISISGTTISGGTQYNVFGAENSFYDRSRIIYHPDAGRFIAINPYATGTTTQKTIYSATVSSLVITASPANATLHYNSSDFFFLTIDGTLLFIDNYGSNIYSVSYDSANSYKPVLTLLTYSHPLIIGNYIYTAIGNSGIYAVLSTGYNSASVLDEKVTTLAFSSIYRYIGSANQSVSNGQSVKIAVSGGIATNLSGLTTGLRYSVSANGSIVPSTSALALATYGTALSATTLLLNPTLVM